MARKNRLVVPDGCYHVTSRTANKEFLFKDPTFKDKMVEWMYGIAEFSGVEIISYTIMDNHFHIFIKTPTVPECYWAPTKGTVPAVPPCAESFGMRPPECRAPRWTPDLGDEHPVVTPAGERLSDMAITASHADGVPVVNFPRPPVGFTMDDCEMIARLRCFYAEWSNAAERIAKKWTQLRERGMGDVVEMEKERLCRRMYNITQFVKAFKERITAGYKRFVDPNHTGTLWEGRFFSGLVENEFKSRLLVASYIDYNPVKAGIVAKSAQYKWCSWAEACSNGPRSESLRKRYCALLGCEWGEARDRIESIFVAKLPVALKGVPENVFCDKVENSLSAAWEGDAVSEGDSNESMIGRLIKLSLVAMKKGAYISFNREFAKRTAKVIPVRFPMPSCGSITSLMRVWRAAKALVA